VEPDEYSQKPGSSGVVAAGLASGCCACKKASISTSEGCSGAAGRETMTFFTSWSDFTIALVSAGNSAPDTRAAWARECSSM
jgi:hypothetical protein